MALLHIFCVVSNICQSQYRKNEYKQFVEALFYVEICFLNMCLFCFFLTKCLLLSLTLFGTWKYDCVIKTKEMFSFRPIIKISVTNTLRYILPFISTMIPWNTISHLLSFYGLYSSLLLLTSSISFRYSIKTSESL